VASKVSRQTGRMLAELARSPPPRRRTRPSSDLHDELAPGRNAPSTPDGIRSRSSGYPSIRRAWRIARSITGPLSRRPRPGGVVNTASQGTVTATMRTAPPDRIMTIRARREPPSCLALLQRRSAVRACHAAHGLRRAVTSRCVTTLPGRRPAGASAGGRPAAHGDLGQLARKYSPMARWTTSETLTCSWAARVSSARSSSGSSLTGPAPAAADPGAGHPPPGRRRKSVSAW